MKRRISNVAFVDVFLLLLIVALALINPPIDPTIEVRPEAIVTVEWGDMDKSDVDTHLILPDGSHINYVYKDAGGRAALNRDDVGYSFDAGGEVIAQNFEVVDIFTLEDGEYRLAVRLFSQNDPEVNVRIRVETTSPYVRWVDTTVKLTQKKETPAIAIFTVKDGKIVKVDTDVDFRL